MLPTSGPKVNKKYDLLWAIWSPRNYEMKNFIMPVSLVGSLPDSLSASFGAWPKWSPRDGEGT